MVEPTHIVSPLWGGWRRHAVSVCGQRKLEGVESAGAAAPLLLKIKLLYTSNDLQAREADEISVRQVLRGAYFLEVKKVIKKLTVFIAMMLLFGTLVRAETFGGVVSDSKCGNNHSSADNADTACVKKCVAGGAKYVLEWGGKVLQLDHQEMFARYPGWVVEVQGFRHGNSLHVISVKPMLHNNF